MTISHDDAIACLKVLVALAKADGRVHADELRSLTASLAGFDVETGPSLGAMLDEEIDVRTEVAKIASPEARQQVFRSAYFLAHADGECSDVEREVLDVVAEVTAPSAEERASLERVFAAAPKKGRIEALKEALYGIFGRG